MRLVNLLNNLREQIYRYRVEYLKNVEVYPRLIKEHETILKALQDRNQELVVEAMRDHVENQATAVTQIIRTQQ